MHNTKCLVLCSAALVWGIELRCDLEYQKKQHQYCNINEMYILAKQIFVLFFHVDSMLLRSYTNLNSRESCDDTVLQREGWQINHREQYMLPEMLLTVNLKIYFTNQCRYQSCTMMEPSNWFTYTTYCVCHHIILFFWWHLASLNTVTQ